MEMEINAAFVEKVENEVGMGHGAWDMVNPEDICRAAVKIAIEQLEYEGAFQLGL